MKYKSFIRIVFVAILIVVIGSGVLITSCITLLVRNAGKSTPAPASAVPVPSVTQQSRRATPEELKTKLSAWLALNSDRHGLMKKEDIMPGESFRATAIRFPQRDAVRWSNKDSQWSQIKIDLDRNGIDDEKWLLKNGRIYKREVLDAVGNTTFMEYLDNK